MDTQKDKLHVGIIMDGNGRWATQQGLSRIKGHIAGAKQVKKIIRHAGEVGIGVLSVWAFSTDNWKRDAKEVDALMALFTKFIQQETQELVDSNVKAIFVGDRIALPKQLQKHMSILEEQTKDNTGLILQMALNYGGTDELLRAIGSMKNEDVEATKESLDAALDTCSVPDPDIIIRTGMPLMGDGLTVWRSSGFMPYQTMQSLCVPTETLWPDFTPDELDRIIKNIDVTERLFGGQR